MRLGINHADTVRSGVWFYRVPVEWTVLFDVKSCGTMSPAVGWAEKKLKVVNVAGETKEKNTGGVDRQAGAQVKTAEVQECKIVSILAESAEEACLAVNKFYGLGGPSALTTAAEGPLEVLVGNGPNGAKAYSGKQAAVAATNLTEVTVR